MNEHRGSENLELLATLSHELRNPLNAILGWATILTRRGDLPEPVTQGLQAIERNSRLQARMIADVLDYAAVSAGQGHLVMETIDPYPVVRAALEGIAAAARDAEVTLEASFDAESLRIAADAARLQQIIGNLLSNAVKFSERGKAVRLAAGRSGDSFRLVVSDQGKGIDAGLLPGIFEPFGRPGAAAPPAVTAVSGSAWRRRSSSPNCTRYSSGRRARERVSEPPSLWSSPCATQQ